MHPIKTALAVGAVALLALGQATAAPRMETPHDKPATAQDPILALANEAKSVVVVTRAKGGFLKDQAAAPALSPRAFSIILERTFSGGKGARIKHSEPTPLPTDGAVAGGFVAAVEGYDGRCGFAIAGLDFSGAEGADGLNALAAAIFCARDAETLAKLAEPKGLAAKLKRIPEK